MLPSQGDCLICKRAQLQLKAINTFCQSPAQPLQQLATSSLANNIMFHRCAAIEDQINGNVLPAQMHSVWE